MLTAAEGGNEKDVTWTPLITGLLVDGEHSSCALCPPGGVLVRGLEYTVPIQLAAPLEMLPFLPVGKVFEIWAGKTVGHGTVMLVFPNGE